MTLEKLLNELIGMGWKPWGKESMSMLVDRSIIQYNGSWLELTTYEGTKETIEPYSLNDLCSIESGLRQFVCENGLYNKKPKYEYIDMGEKHICPRRYSYRLILSSIQTDKEKFLLENIKI